MAGSDTFLVTGLLGCIGTWIAAELVREGTTVIGFDRGDATHRLDLVLSAEERSQVRLLPGDVTDLAAIGEALDEHEVTHVVHLAALQIPACKADPAMCARVNVLGTVNVFEAVKARRPQIAGVAYASSVAVYGPNDTGAEQEETSPATIYGVYKRATEELARVYWQDDRLPSAALRPYTVFGLGRDRGMTSAPTLAMEAAARGESFHIGFGGRTQFDYVRDVARALIVLARDVEEGAVIHNMPGRSVAMSEVAASIERAAPSDVRIDFDDVPLPFPEELQSSLEFETTPLDDAIAETVAAFANPR